MFGKYQYPFGSDVDTHLMIMLLNRAKELGEKMVQPTTSSIKERKYILRRAIVVDHDTI